MMYGLEQAGVLVQFPLSLSQLAKCYPTTSFTSKVPLTEYSDFGVVDVFTSECPPYNRETHKAQLTTPNRTQDGKWYRNWIIESLSEEELAARDSSVSFNIRNQRNLLLKETDWTQLSDAQPVVYSINEYVEYRQALRDITNQEGFPNNVIWPEKPQEPA
jgi:hypothetical protein